MTWESIGSTNTGQMPDDEAWILFSIGLAKQYVLFVCGDPPEGSKLGVMWHDHELGSYPSLPVVPIWGEANHLVGANQTAETMNIDRGRRHALGFVDDQAGEDASILVEATQAFD